MDKKNNKTPLKTFGSGVSYQSLEEDNSVDLYRAPLRDVIQTLNTCVQNGLTTDDVKLRLQTNGPNVLTSLKTTPEWMKFCHHLFSGFQLLLWFGSAACFIAYAFQPSNDDIQLHLGVVLIILILGTSIFCYYQEAQSANIVKCFNKMVPHNTVVARDGIVAVIPSDELVIGDVVHIKAGDKIPADVRLVTANTLYVDNSSFTGESEAQLRIADNDTGGKLLDSQNVLFFSTSCVQGNGIGVVIKTGNYTMMGNIASATSQMSFVDTPLSREIRHFVRIIASVAIICGLVVFCACLVLNYSLVESMQYLIGITVANVPEGLLPTVTVCLTLIAKRMAKKNCLVKHLEAVETLGSTSVICSDKTGTLTENQMTVRHVFVDNELIEIHNSKTTFNMYSNEACNSFVRACCLCSAADFASQQDHLPHNKRKCFGNATDIAIFKCMDELIGNVSKFRKRFHKLHDIPFDSTTKCQATFHKLGDIFGLICMKGAPEQVIDRCLSILVDNKEIPMTVEQRNSLLSVIDQLCDKGERVIGVCDKRFKLSSDLNYEKSVKSMVTGDFRFLGLISMQDPPRIGVREAVLQCKSAGLRVVMVTGDHPTTAKAIAKQVGILSDSTIMQVEDSSSTVGNHEQSQVYVGSQIAKFTTLELDTILQHNKELVFARTSPADKLAIVESFQRLGYVVGVTGDGVNDAPALKKADIGIAMGINGSEVSREAADMVLLDDNFTSIVKGIEEGRLIFDNIKKSIVYTLTSNVPEFFPFVMFVFIGIPLPFSTLGVLLVDLGSDIIPAISLAFEKAEDDIMSRTPRNPAFEPLVKSTLIQSAYAQIGVIEASAAFLAYFFVMGQNGFLPSRLLGIRADWDNKAINDLEDSYGQEWSYGQRRTLQQASQTAYFLAIVVTQIANLIIRKTSRVSIFRHGIFTRVTIISVLIELGLALSLIYIPWLSSLVRMHWLYLEWCLSALPFAILIVVYEEIRKFVIRRYPLGWLEKNTCF